MPTSRQSSVKNQLKREELEWVGVEEYLKSGDKFSREDVANFIHNNGVKVVEVVGATQQEGEEVVFDWTSSIDEDSSNWEGFSEDYIYSFDRLNDIDDIKYELDWLDTEEYKSKIEE